MEAITGISLLLALVFILSLILKRIRQPLLVGYVLAGLLAARFLDIPESYLSMMSEIGISFLLFIVGIHLSPKTLSRMGRNVVIISIIQVLGVFAASYLILSPFMNPLIPAISLAFSSTIIAMKTLSDENELKTLHGKMAVGILIMQDVAAIIVLSLISSGNAPVSMVFMRLSVVLLVAVVLWQLVSRLDSFIAKSQDLLFLFSLAWLFSISTLFRHFGLSPEMGALLAGVLLSNSQYRHEISSKVKPLRDFFIIMFFVVIGSHMGPIDGTVLIFLAITMLLKPAVIYFSMRAFGYLERPSLLTSFSLAQLSEFSIILVSVASRQMNISGMESIITATVISMALTPYMFSLAEKLRIGKKRMKKVERPYDTILFGCNRIGHIILKSLKGRVLVVDFDPDVVKSLKGVDVVYGDASDEDLLEEIRVSEAKMIISTIPDYETNLLILSKSGRNALKIMVSYDIEEAIDFYRNGATLVLMPHFLGGEYVASVITRHGFDFEKYEMERRKHIRLLMEKKRLGHKHPHRS